MCTLEIAHRAIRSSKMFRLFATYHRFTLSTSHYTFLGAFALVSETLLSTRFSTACESYKVKYFY